MMEICGKCKKLFETHERFQSVECSGPCSNQFHNLCTNLNDNEISCLKLSTNIKWFCDYCLVSGSIASVKNDRNENITTGRLLKQLEIQENLLFDIQNRLKQLESEKNIRNCFINRKAKDINSSPEQSGKRKKLIILGVLVILALLIVATVLGSKALNDSKSKLVLGNSEESRNNIPINSTIAQDNVGGGYILRIVPRDGWLAQPSINDLIPLNHPVQRIIVIPTRTSECETQAACTYTVRITQTFNIESQQQDDIIYNFLIGGDGNVYEGRGWNFKGSVVKGYNDDSISFAYIGSFKKQPPSYKQLNVTKLLLQEGVSLNKISPNYRIVGANKLDPTSVTTLADALYKSFENWPHWSDK